MLILSSLVTINLIYKPTLLVIPPQVNRPQR